MPPSPGAPRRVASLARPRPRCGRSARAARPPRRRTGTRARSAAAGTRGRPRSHGAACAAGPSQKPERCRRRGVTSRRSRARASSCPRRWVRRSRPARARRPSVCTSRTTSRPPSSTVDVCQLQPGHPSLLYGEPAQNAVPRVVRRRNARVAMNLPVEVIAHGKKVRAVTQDLSAYGMFVRLAPPLELAPWSSS